MRKIFLFGVVFCFLAAGVGWWYVKSQLPAKILTELQVRGGEALGGPLMVGQLQILSYYPTFRLILKDISLQSKNYGINGLVKQLELTAHHESGLLDFDQVRFKTRLEITDPDFTYRPPEVPVKASAGTGSKKAAGSGPVFDSSLELVIRGGSFHSLPGLVKKGLHGQKPVHLSNQNKPVLRSQKPNSLSQQGAAPKAGASDVLGVKSLAVDLSLGSLLGNNIGLALKLKADIEAFGLELPFSIEAPSFQYYNNIVKADQLKIILSGIEAVFKGWSGLKPLTHNWSSNFTMKDLSKLNFGKILQTQGAWTGSLSGQVSVNQAANSLPHIKFKLAAKDIAGAITFSRTETNVSGPFQLNLAVDGEYFRAPVIKSFAVDGNFTKMNLISKPYFSKAPGQKMGLKASGSYLNQLLNLKTGQVQLGPWLLEVLGSISHAPGGHSQVKLNLPSRELKGLEKIFPVLGQYPVRGRLGLKALIRGDLTQPKKLFVKLNPLKLQSVSGRMDLNDLQRGLKILGPYRLSLNADVEIHNLKPAKSAIDFSGDLSAMKISYSPKGGGTKMEKSNTDKFKFHFVTRQQKDQVKIKKGSLQSWLGNLKVSGRIKDLNKPKIQLGLKVKGVSFKSLSPWVPMLNQYNLKGSMGANIKVTGRYDLKKDISTNPIVITGKAKVDLLSAKYIWPIPKSTQPTSAKNQTTVQAASFGPVLPKWPLFRKSKLKFGLKVKELILERPNSLNKKVLKTKLKNIDANVKLNQGRFFASAKLGRAFNGIVNIKSLSTDPMSSNMKVKIKGFIRGLHLGPAINFTMPDWKNLVKGVFTAPFQLHAPLGGNLMGDLVAKGSFDLQRGYLNSAKFDQSMNKLTKSIPGLNVSKLDSKGVSGNIKGSYKVRSQRIELKSFSFLTPERNEFQGAGFLGFDKRVNMTGTLFLPEKILKDKKMRDCFSDGTGRVKMPLVVKGKLSEPSLGLAQGTLAKITSTLLECEKKRQVQKLKANINQKLKKQLETSKLGKKLEKIGGKKELENKLKSLFK